jgi:hypothetical protein
MSYRDYPKLIRISTKSHALLEKERDKQNKERKGNNKITMARILDNIINKHKV